MATRTLTEVFILMRNNAIQSRNFYSDQTSSDTASLVRHEGGEINIRDRVTEVRMPPEWTDSLEEAQYILTKIQTRLKELTALQNKHVNKTSVFDDSMQEEKQIDDLTQEITKMFNTCHNCIKRIQNNSLSLHRGGSDANVAKNVVSSLVTTLQNLSSAFRRDQNAYLEKIKSREERSLPDSMRDWNLDDWNTPSNEGPRATSQQELLMMEENTSYLQQREKEIQHVVRSIVELNSIFKEVSHMVAEQGSVLDRIDYNVEQSQVRVHEGLVHLQKAERYQKKSRKTMCIIFATITVIVLIIILFAVNS